MASTAKTREPRPRDRRAAAQKGLETKRRNGTLPAGQPDHFARSVEQRRIAGQDGSRRIRHDVMWIQRNLPQLHPGRPRASALRQLGYTVERTNATRSTPIENQVGKIMRADANGFSTYHAGHVLCAPPDFIADLRTRIERELQRLNVRPLNDGDPVPPPDPTTKHCSECRCVKPLATFGVNPLGRQGRHSKCNDCVNAARRLRRASMTTMNR